MALTPEAFLQKYTSLKDNERAAAQTHFNDLCELLGVARPLDHDPEALHYRFEKPVLKVAGGKGFADVWWRGKFGWEYKGKGLISARRISSFSPTARTWTPPLLILSDMQTIELHTNFTGTQKAVITWTLDDLRDSA